LPRFQPNHPPKWHQIANNFANFANISANNLNRVLTGDWKLTTIA